MIETRDSALSHIRVLELGALPASYAGHFLADLGADVIKIEPPGGDRTRMDSPFLGDIAGPDRSLAFVHINANKRSIMLDFAKAADRRVFADLVETADAVVEACPVGYLGSLNLGYEHLKAANPAITLISLTPFGQVGPLRQFKGNNGIAEAMGGVIFPLGDDTRAPCVSPNDFLTQIAGVHGASSTLAAIYNRRQGGGGQQVDISLQDVGTQVQTGLSEYGLRRLLRRRPGIVSSSGASSIFATRDGFVYLQPAMPHMWAAIVGWMEDPVLAGPEWLDRDYKNQNADVIHTLFGEFVATMITEEFVAGAQDRGIPSAPVERARRFIESEQVRDVESFTEKSHPVIGKYETVNFMRMNASPLQFRLPAPSLDQHRAELLAEAGQDRSRSSVPVGGAGGRKLPLEGIRVLDFTRVIAGPGGTQILGFLGAEVIKVESQGLNTGRENSGAFPELNRAKKSITLDVRTPEGRELALRLAEKSDIVINNFSAFVMDRLILAYEDFVKVKPDIIYLRMPGFGRAGPLKDFVAYGQILQSFTGLVSMWKHPESPTEAGIKGPVGDYISVAQVALGALAALEYRDQTGKGQIVDLTMMEAVAATLNPLYMDYALNHREPEPFGYRSARYAPYGAYPCRGDDAWCVIAVETEEEWQAFQKAIGEPGWVFDPKFATTEGRIENREELDANIAMWTEENTKQQVMHFLQRDGVPAGAVQSAEDLFNDYHLRKRGHVVEVHHPAPWGTYEGYGTSARFAVTPANDAAPAPELGQHNGEVFGGLLGLSSKEIQRLQDARVIC